MAKTYALNVATLNTRKASRDLPEEQYEYFAHLSGVFKSMLNNEELSDFTFTVQQNTYFAHKFVLCSRSPVFAAMFRSNMSETHTNNVVIDDCDCDVFEVFLNYLYTGEIFKVKQLAFDLFPIADKYEIIELKYLCENSIKIKNDNALKVIVMADVYNADELKKKAIHFIVDNLREIRSKFGDEFKQFRSDYPQLFEAIFDAIEKKLCSRPNNKRKTFMDLEDTTFMAQI